MVTSDAGWGGGGSCEGGEDGVASSSQVVAYRVGRKPDRGGAATGPWSSRVLLQAGATSAMGGRRWVRLGLG